MNATLYKPDIATARAKGDYMANACAIKAEAESTFDTARAAQLILRRLQSMDGPVSCEDLTDYVISRGLQPHDGRAFGPVFKSLSRRGLIMVVDYTPRRKGNGSPGGRMWEITDAGRAQV